MFVLKTIINFAALVVVLIKFKTTFNASLFVRHRRF